jgi:threonine/homoserine/homoserine lactone efflux protein
MDYLILLTIGFFAAITPGPDIFYVLRQGLCKGKASALWAVFGILVGNIIYLVLVGIGIGSFGKSLYFQIVVGVLGGVYLLNIAKSIYLEKPKFQKSCDNLDRFKIFKEALLLNLSNPKAMIFFAVIVTPFMGKSTILSLSSLFAGISLAFIIAALLSSVININNRLLMAINKIASILFVAFAIGLFSSAYKAFTSLKGGL